MRNKIIMFVKLLTQSAISESPFASPVSTINWHVAGVSPSVAAVAHPRGREGQGEGHKDTDSGECGGFHFETEIDMSLMIAFIAICFKFHF